MLEWQENKELPDLIVVIHSVFTFYDCIAHRVVLMLLFCGSGGGIGTVLPLSNQRVTNF